MARHTCSTTRCGQKYGDDRKSSMFHMKLALFLPWLRLDIPWISDSFLADEYFVLLIELIMTTRSTDASAVIPTMFKVYSYPSTPHCCLKLLEECVSDRSLPMSSMSVNWIHAHWNIPTYKSVQPRLIWAEAETPFVTYSISSKSGHQSGFRAWYTGNNTEVSIANSNVPGIDDIWLSLCSPLRRWHGCCCQTARTWVGASLITTRNLRMSVHRGAYLIRI